jgi:hypothetical protein
MEGSAAVALRRFDRDFFDGSQTFTGIGSGEIGGKAEGLRLIRDEILPHFSADASPFFNVDVPNLTVVTTEVFEDFMEVNQLAKLIESAPPDDRIAHAFQRAEFPPEWVGDLRAIAAQVHTPLAVRSSSLLEDHLHHPFAGVYDTKMIPNAEFEEDARFRRLIEAVKFVYASTFFKGARDYLQVVGLPPGSERMAVIVQEVLGRRVNHRYYPHISGVARSFNFYPTGGARPSDGVVYLALGLGKTVVDGESCWHYSPATPKAPPPFNDLGDLLKNTQTSFWAVHMGEPPVPDPIRETEHLVRPGLTEAEDDGSLKYLVSTYDPQSDRLSPGLGGRGPRALTFAPLLGSRLIPFNQLLEDLLERAKSAVGSDVEIEFAVTLDERDGVPARFGLLQVRQMLVGGEDVTVTPDQLEGDAVLVASDNVLGNGRIETLTDVVYLRPEAFDPARTFEMAVDLEEINKGLIDEGRRYLLIGFGRWGTSDARHGVPIVWPQISGARAIVEATLPQVNPDLSQGSHFFHNLLSFQVLYFSVRHDGPSTIDWDWLDRQPAMAESEMVRHVRTANPLSVRVDGAGRRGVITHHD